MTNCVRYFHFTDELVFNAAELKISEAKVNGEKAVSVDLNEDQEKATVKLAKPLEAATKAVFTCNFVGELNDKMRGEQITREPDFCTIPLTQDTQSKV